MINIGILGFGIVGGGVAEVLEQDRPAIEKALGKRINIKSILDLRTFEGTQWESKIVQDIKNITEDAEISIVVEAMGGSHPAYEFTAECLKSGKSVVTSNKEVVANFGAELLAIAEKSGAFYLFEGSVGGGIPLIRSIRSSFTGDEIFEVNGILNGTTNFILTKMEEGVSFDDAVADAQALGYAEKNPAADVDGIDAQRKICILTALTSKILLTPSDIHTESMRRITVADVRGAKASGHRIKLIGHMKKDSDKISVFVMPCFVPLAFPLANISDVYNGIIVDSPILGSVMYYGRGAGRYPTAGAVVADIVNIANGAESSLSREMWKSGTKDMINNIGDMEFRHYIRIESDDISAEKIAEIFGSADVIANSGNIGAVEFITEKMKYSEIEEKISHIKGAVSRICVL